MVSAIAELISAVIALFITSFIVPILPYILSFAAGCAGGCADDGCAAGMFHYIYACYFIAAAIVTFIPSDGFAGYGTVAK